MHKMTNMWKFELNWSSKLQENYERKNTVAQMCVLSDVWKRLQAWSLLLFKWEITSFSKNILLQKEPFLTMFHYQQLTIACYQVSLYANDYVLIITDSILCLWGQLSCSRIFRKARGVLTMRSASRKYRIWGI